MSVKPRQTGHSVIGPVLRRDGFTRAVRAALRLRADTFAFSAQPGVKAAELRQGCQLWADRGGVPPLAVIELPDDADPKAHKAAAMAGVQSAVMAGAGAAVLELSRQPSPGGAHRPGTPAGRDVVAAAAPHAAGVPLLYALTAADMDDRDLIAWLTAHAGGWYLDPGRLFAAGWWDLPRLAATGQALQRSGLPGAIWVREPAAAAPDAAQSPLGLGAMGLPRWWDVFAQPWTVGVPVYVELPGPGTTGGAELHSLRRLLHVSRQRA